MGGESVGSVTMTGTAAQVSIPCGSLCKRHSPEPIVENLFEGGKFIGHNQYLSSDLSGGMLRGRDSGETECELVCMCVVCVCVSHACV